MKKNGIITAACIVSLTLMPASAFAGGPEGTSGSSSSGAAAISGSQSGAVSGSTSIAGGGEASAGAFSSLNNSTNTNTTTSASNALTSSPAANVTINQSSVANNPRQIIPGVAEVIPTQNTAECIRGKSFGIGFPYGSIGGSGGSKDEECEFRVRARDMASYGGQYGLNISCEMFYTRYQDVSAAMNKLGVDCSNLQRPAPAAIVAPQPPVVKPAEEQIDPPALGDASATGLPLPGTTVVQPQLSSLTLPEPAFGQLKGQ